MLVRLVGGLGSERAERYYAEHHAQYQKQRKESLTLVHIHYLLGNYFQTNDKIFARRQGITDLRQGAGSPGRFPASAV